MHYINLVDPSFEGIPAQANHYDQKTVLLRQFVLGGLLCNLQIGDMFKASEMYEQEYWQVAAYHLLGYAKYHYKNLTMVQFRKRAELQSLRFLSWDEYHTKNLVQHYNLI